VTSKVLGYWERGVTPPPGDKLLELLLVLEVAPAELLAAGEKKRSTRLRRHEGPGTSERRSDMSDETMDSMEMDPGVVIEPDLKSERVQEESVSPIPPEPGPVQAG
jgi:hypothetical protein